MIYAYLFTYCGQPFKNVDEVISGLGLTDEAYIIL